MAQGRKRIPGEPNPTPDTDETLHVARESWMGGHSYGIAAALVALVDWRKRRKARARR